MSFEPTVLTRQEEILLDLDHIQARDALYQQILGEFADARLGQSISKRERDQTRQDDKSLVYGEITFESFAIAMQKIRLKYGKPGKGYSGDAGVLQKPGGVFVDLGSGTGKACLAAALMHPFEQVRGIEVLEGLHRFATEAIQPQFETVAKPLLESGQPPYDEVMPEVRSLSLLARSWARLVAVSFECTRAIARNTDRVYARECDAMFVVRC